MRPEGTEKKQTGSGVVGDGRRGARGARGQAEGRGEVEGMGRSGGGGAETGGGAGRHFPGASTSPPPVQHSALSLPTPSAAQAPTGWGAGASAPLRWQDGPLAGKKD